ncbi:MAG: HlyD family type I secretion periplasmic adaptor subunit [Notoacmeibacter sp.]
MVDTSIRGSKSMVFLLALLLFAAVVWAALTHVDEVTRGDGRVIPAGRTQQIQATEPGVVTEIAVKVGQTVSSGDLVVRLDDTMSTSDLGEVQARSRALQAKVARLEAEQGETGEPAFLCPKDVMESAPAVCANEEALLESRRAGFQNTAGVLEQRQLQRENELEEARANIDRIKGSLTISKRELGILAPMARRKLVAETELIRVQREVNDAEGQLKALAASVPRLEGAIEEAKLQVRELGLQFRQEAQKERTDVLAELSVLEEAERGESNRVKRTDIRSPVNGVVNRLEVNTIGSFVQPGAIVAEIVPTSVELLVEARIAPKDVAFVVPGQQALVKVTAFDFSVYGGLSGTVVNVGSDSIVDQKTGEPYFEVRVKTDKSQLERNGRTFGITPGMVCSVDVMTGRKSILHYLLKPFNKARQEALTER